MFYRLADTSPKNPNCNCIRPLCAASRREKSSSAQFSADLLVCLTYPCHNHICPGPHRQFQHSRRRNHRHPHHHQWQQQQFTQHAAFYRLLGLLRQRAMCKKCFSLKSCFTILLSSRRRRWRRPGSPPFIPLRWQHPASWPWRRGRPAGVRSLSQALVTMSIKQTSDWASTTATPTAPTTPAAHTAPVPMYIALQSLYITQNDPITATTTSNYF